MRLFYFLLFISFQVPASTCLITGEMQRSWNESYATLIQVKITKTEVGNDVLISFPKKVKELTLSFVFLHLGADDNPELVSQLGTNKDSHL